jgi:hypothetical protein
LRGLVVGVLLLGAGAAGAYLYMNRDKYFTAGTPDERRAADDPGKDDDDPGKGDEVKPKDKDPDKVSATTPADTRATDRKPQGQKPPEESAVRPGDYDPTPRPKPDPKPDPMPKPDPKPDPVAKPDPIPKPDVKPAEGRLPAAEQAKVNAAIDRGVKALLALQGADGSWPGHAGMTALAGVTLLECGLPAVDPAVQKAAEDVRARVIRSSQVYAIATAILFLDRLGDSADVALLEALTVRLLAGQVDNGGWGYEIPAVAEEEVKRLEEHYRQAKEKKPDAPKKPRTVRDLAPEVQQQLRLIRPRRSADAGGTDNSNTQFVTLALWVGRRQGVPVDAALALVDSRFRHAQNPDGGWGYLSFPGNPDATLATMTCAGVLGLSVNRGLVLKAGKPAAPDAGPALDPARDAVLRKALGRLAMNVDQPPSVKKVPPPKLAGTDYYFLW